jgi:multicomponent K+:H+ antiporter subunit E
MSPRPLLPYPVLSVLLLLLWLLLQQSASVAQLLFGALFAWGLPWLVQGFLGPGARPRRPLLALHLMAVVLKDIVMSNLTVARLVLSPTARPQPVWVPVPLQLQSPLGRSLLASCITMTPGTLSCTVDEARGLILVHALDCSDAAALAADIQTRYEAPLRQLFDGDAA